MAKKAAETAKNDESSEPTKPTVDESTDSAGATKGDVWTAEGTLAEQIEKQRLINEGKLKRA